MTSTTGSAHHARSQSGIRPIVRMRVAQPAGLTGVVRTTTTQGDENGKVHPVSLIETPDDEYLIAAKPAFLFDCRPSRFADFRRTG